MATKVFFLDPHSGEWVEAAALAAWGFTEEGIAALPRREIEVHACAHGAVWTTDAGQIVAGEKCPHGCGD